jgi:hypothetical protein
MRPFEVNVSSPRGAPMGRPSTPVDLIARAGKARLQRVPLVSGDYDRGGAYWGGRPSPNLYCVWNDAGANFFRAADRSEAISLLRESAIKLARPY